MFRLRVLILISPLVATTALAQAAPQQASASPSSPLPDSTRIEQVVNVKAEYPREAAEKGIQGEVTLKLHVSETGDVDDVDVLSGDPILANAAVDAAKQWKYKPYIKDGHPIRIAVKVPIDFKVSDKVPVSGLAYRISASQPAPPAAPPQFIRVSQGVSQGLLIKKVNSVYSPENRHNRIQGTVTLAVTVDKEGTVTDVKAVSGPNELQQAAIDAVQQWRYRPYLLNGQPVEVHTTVVINFTLSGN